MIREKHTIKRMVILFSIVAVTVTGCTTRANNQMSPQRAPRPSAQNLRQADVDNRIEIANEAAAKIVHLNGITQANVLVTRKNAYVAAIVDTNQGHITPEMKDRIAQQVRSTDPYIQNVFVSTNPEFVDRVNRYVADVRQGHPVTGFVQEFNDMVQRIFPNAR